jgi:hypothetical protein
LNEIKTTWFKKGKPAFKYLNAGFPFYFGIASGYYHATGFIFKPPTIHP